MVTGGRGDGVEGLPLALGALEMKRPLTVVADELAPIGVPRQSLGEDVGRTRIQSRPLLAIGVVLPVRRLELLEPVSLECGKALLGAEARVLGMADDHDLLGVRIVLDLVEGVHGPGLARVRGALAVGQDPEAGERLLSVVLAPGTALQVEPPQRVRLPALELCPANGCRSRKRTLHPARARSSPRRETPWARLHPRLAHRPSGRSARSPSQRMAPLEGKAPASRERSGRTNA